jgi:hypothetical protein
MTYASLPDMCPIAHPIAQTSTSQVARKLARLRPKQEPTTTRLRVSGNQLARDSL